MRLLANFRRSWFHFREHEGSRIAAAIAFYVLLSAVPAVALLIASIGWMIRDPVEQAHVLSHMFEIMPLGSIQNRTFLMETVRVVRESGGRLTILGTLGLGWAALGMFAAVRWGLNRAFSGSRRSGLVRVKLMDLMAAVIIWLLLLVSSLGTAALHIFLGESEEWTGGHPGGISFYWTLAQWTIPAVLTFLAFVFLYRYVPNVAHGTRDVIPASIIATVLFEVSKFIFARYMEYVSSHQRIYSALGGTFGFILWVYVSAVLLLWGAEYATVYRQRREEARAKRSKPAPSAP